MLDKTGAITTGRMRVAAVHATAGKHVAEVQTLAGLLRMLPGTRSPVPVPPRPSSLPRKPYDRRLRLFKIVTSAPNRECTQAGRQGAPYPPRNTPQPHRNHTAGMYTSSTSPNPGPGRRSRSSVSTRCTATTKLWSASPSTPELPLQPVCPTADRIWPSHNQTSGGSTGHRRWCHRQSSSSTRARPRARRQRVVTWAARIPAWPAPGCRVVCSCGSRDCPRQG